MYSHTHILIPLTSEYTFKVCHIVPKFQIKLK